PGVPRRRAWRDPTPRRGGAGRGSHTRRATRSTSRTGPRPADRAGRSAATPPTRGRTGGPSGGGKCRENARRFGRPRVAKARGRGGERVGGVVGQGEGEGTVRPREAEDALLEPWRQSPLLLFERRQG